MTKEKALKVAHKLLMRLGEGDTTYLGMLLNAQANEDGETYIFYLQQLKKNIDALIEDLKQ